MTTHPARGRPRRRLRAVLVGLGLEDGESPHRVIHGPQCLIMGGSPEVHADLLETVLRLEFELERRGRTLGEIPPHELAEIAWRIDSPELHRVALQMAEGLSSRGCSFQDATAQELTELSVLADEPESEAPRPFAG